jgi:hypothetical protein
MISKIDNRKCFNMRMPKDVWMFLKTQSLHNDVTMTEIIISCVEKYKRNVEKKLTNTDTQV